MRFILALFLMISVAFSAFPKVFQTMGDKVYPYIQTCKSLKTLRGEMGQQCEMFYLTASSNLKLGYSLDKRKSQIKAGDISISKYIKTLQFLEVQKDEITDTIFRTLNTAIKKRHAKTVSKLFTAPSVSYNKAMYQKIAAASLNLTLPAQKKLGRYTNKKIRKKERTKSKRKTIKSKKNKAVFCHLITPRSAMKADYGVANALVVGRAKNGYVLQDNKGKRIFLEKASCPKKFGILESVSLEVQGRGAARKVAYVYFDGSSKMRMSETIPFVKYGKEAKAVCRN